MLTETGTALIHPARSIWERENKTDDTEIVPRPLSWLCVARHSRCMPIEILLKGVACQFKNRLVVPCQIALFILVRTKSPTTNGVVVSLRLVSSFVKRYAVNRSF